MRKCDKCSSEWPDGMKFCGNCGNSLEVKETRKLTRRRTAERRYAVVLFADIHGYTGLSAEVDPEELHNIMQPIYNIMADCVDSFGGTTAKYIGDCVMALFGAPRAHEDDEVRAVECALELNRRMAEYPETHGRKLKLTVGVNSGMVIAGDIGDAVNFDFDALGDTVNVAARLQGKADVDEVLVSEKVGRRIARLFDIEKVGPYDLKNVPEPVYAFKVKGVSDRSDFYGFISNRRSGFFGRESELAKMGSVYEGVKNGRGAVLLVTGKAGTGKSRLAYEFVERAGREGTRVLLCRSARFGGESLLQPLKDLLRRHAEVHPAEKAEPARKRIENVFSRYWNDETTRRLRLAAVEFLLGYEPEDTNFAALDAKARAELVEVSINDFLVFLAKEAADRNGLALVFEDVHLAGEGVKGWVNQFARLTGDFPVLLILVGRDMGEDAFGFDGDISVERVVVENLDEEAARNHIQAILGGTPPSVELARFVTGKSQGNPFYSEEIIEHLLSTGVIKTGSGEVKLTRKLKDVEIPSSVSSLVLSRVDRLDKEIRRVLQEASVIGYSFLDRLLEKISDSPDGVGEELEELLGSEIVYQENPGQGEYAFRQAVTRDAVYSTLLKSESRELHGLIAEAMEELFSENVTDFYHLLAYHYGKARSREKQAEYLYLDGLRKRDAGARREALESFREAETLMADGDGRKPETLFNLVELEMNVVSREAAEKTLARIPDGLGFYETMKKRILECTVLRSAGDNRAVLEKLEALKEELEDRSPGEGERKAHFENLGAVYYSLADIHSLFGETGKMESEYERLLEIARKSGDLKLEIQAYRVISINCLKTSRFEESIEYSRKALGVSEKSGDLMLQCSSLMHIGIALQNMGKIEDARESYMKALELCAMCGSRLTEAALLANIGNSYVAMDEPGKALEYQKKAYQIYRETGHVKGQADSLSDMGVCYSGLKKTTEALSAHEKSLEIRRKIGDRLGQAVSLGNLGDSYQRAEQFEKAMETFEESMRLSEKIDDGYGVVWSMAKIAETNILLKRGDKARQALDKALETAKKINLTGLSEYLETLEKKIGK